MNSMQPAAFKPMADGIPADAGVEKITPRNHPVLTPRHQRDQLVHRVTARLGGHSTPNVR
jgi:hypothetical protein